MAFTVAKVKKLVLNKGVKNTPPKLKRAQLTKKQIAKRKLPKPISGKAKRARLTKKQIAKRRAKGITTASVVGRPAVPVNKSTVVKRKPVVIGKKKPVRWI